MSERVIYTLRPDRTPLWLPVSLMDSLGLKHGDELTAEQFGDARVRDLLLRRASRKKGAELT